MNTDRMPANPSPTVRQRRLGREVRQCREAARMSPDEAASQLGWSTSKLSRIETGRTKLTVQGATEALELYGADSGLKANLLHLVREARQRGWWAAYSDVFTGSFIDMEDQAESIRAWEPQLVPGLLQTADYARAVIQAGRSDLSESAVDTRVRARMSRQPLLTKPTGPEYHVILDEAVFRRFSVEPKIRTGQLNALLTLPESVTLQVLTFSAGIQPGMEGAFVTISFGAEDPDVAYIEGTGGDLYVESSPQVVRCNLVFEHISDVALSPEDSAAWIENLKEQSR